MDRYFLLFSNCIPVKGASRSVIVDLQREDMFFLPNELYELVKELNEKPYASVCDLYDQESIASLDEFIRYLQDCELGFWTDSPSFFPPLDLSWDSPSLITNALIDVKGDCEHPWERIFDELENLGCKDLQIRCYDTMEPFEISRILSLLDRRRIKSAELILKFDPRYTKTFARTLTKQFLRIRTLYFHSAPVDDVYLMKDSKSALAMGNIVYTKQSITANDHCGKISPSYFAFGLSTFTESVHFNSCLNRKVSIDHNGDLKNCPSLPNVYGNIHTHSISDVLDSNFKALWHVTKDQVSICRDCEFRYVCTDCRAFLDNPNDKPKKCSYDPYTTQWA